MLTTISYIPHGVCCTRIDITIKDGCVEQVCFTGGCHGNGQGLSALLRGMSVADAIVRLGGINCDGRGTSCPDQVAQALAQIQ
jgi:uncharacterized protein (TIGR03905 family)